MTTIKKLYFGPPYPRILFTGDKNKTFRVSSGDRYNVDDDISLCCADGREFAKATVSRKTRKTFAELEERDWEGHERFSSERDMYMTYSNWERSPVTPETSLDIIEYKNFAVTDWVLAGELFSN